MKLKMRFWGLSVMLVRITENSLFRHVFDDGTKPYRRLEFSQPRENMLLDYIKIGGVFIHHYPLPHNYGIMC